MASDASRPRTSAELIQEDRRAGALVLSLVMVIEGVFLMAGANSTKTSKICFDLLPQPVWGVLFFVAGTSILWLRDPWRTFLATLTLTTWAGCLALAAIYVDGASGTGWIPWFGHALLTVVYGRRARAV